MIKKSHMMDLQKYWLFFSFKTVFCFSREKKKNYLSKPKERTKSLKTNAELQESIFPSFYEQLLRAKIPKPTKTVKSS